MLNPIVNIRQEEKADEENSTGRRNTGGCKPTEGSVGD
jgi:hypothetical protein